MMRLWLAVLLALFAPLAMLRKSPPHDPVNNFTAVSLVELSKLFD